MIMRRILFFRKPLDLSISGFFLANETQWGLEETITNCRELRDFLVIRCGVASPRLIMKNHGKKREERDRKRYRGPRGSNFCGHAVIVPQGECNEQERDWKSFGLNIYHVHTHFHYKFIRHSDFSLSVSISGHTALSFTQIFSRHYLFLNFRSIL